jgi:hypothetical protein
MPRCGLHLCVYPSAVAQRHHAPAFRVLLVLAVRTHDGLAQPPARVGVRRGWREASGVRRSPGQPSRCQRRHESHGCERFELECGGGGAVVWDLEGRRGDASCGIGRNIFAKGGERFPARIRKAESWRGRFLARRARALRGRVRGAWRPVALTPAPHTSIWAVPMAVRPRSAVPHRRGSQRHRQHQGRWGRWTV